MNSRHLNRYTLGSIVALFVFALVEAGLTMSKPLWEPVLGPIQNGQFHIIEVAGIGAIYILVLVELFLSWRAIKTIDATREIGRTLSWIFLIPSAALTIYFTLLLVFLLIGGVLG